jgi:hypothetical protein
MSRTSSRAIAQLEVLAERGAGEPVADVPVLDRPHVGDHLPKLHARGSDGRVREGEGDALLPLDRAQSARREMLLVDQDERGIVPAGKGDDQLRPILVRRPLTAGPRRDQGAGDGQCDAGSHREQRQARESS